MASAEISPWALRCGIPGRSNRIFRTTSSATEVACVNRASTGMPPQEGRRCEVEAGRRSCNECCRSAVGMRDSEPLRAHDGRRPGTWLAVWWVPVLAVTSAFGRHSVLAREGIFGEAVPVTFGGAYVGLAYVVQRAVIDFHLPAASAGCAGEDGGAVLGSFLMGCLDSSVGRAF